MAKQVLFILSERGFWGEELVGPLEALEAAGHTCVFATPTGRTPVALRPSKDPTFVDPPLDKRVTSVAMADRVQALEASGRLEKPMALVGWFPERPYVSAPHYLRKLEAYHDALRLAQKSLASYDAVVLVGGSGPIVDMVNNQRVHDLVLGFHAAGKVIGAICYGVATLVLARDVNERVSIIAGKHVTGHCVEYDYHDGTGFVGSDLNMGPPPYCLEYLLRDAVGPSGQYHGNFGKPTSVIVDHPFVTARSNQCSTEFGARLVDVLDRGLTRSGW